MRNMLTTRPGIIFLAALAHLFSVLHTFSAQAQSMETVFVSILPQKNFMEQICGDLLNIEVMVQPGASPATYEPKASQMRKLAESKAYFAIGVPFENAWLERIGGVNPTMPIVHTDSGIEKVSMVEQGKTIESGHGHDHHDHHGHHGLDPHIWLSPVLVKKQAANITAALVRLFPDKAPVFQANHDLFSQRLDSLHGELQRRLQPYTGRKFMVFHPSWGYFAREYGLEQVAIEIEGKNPKPAQVQILIEEARKEGIRIIFAQKQFSTKNAQIIAKAIDGEVVLVDPLAEEWFANILEVADKFEQAFN